MFIKKKEKERKIGVNINYHLASRGKTLMKEIMFEEIQVWVGHLFSSLSTTLTPQATIQLRF